MNLSVSRLGVYPVKSCAGWSLKEASVVDIGFEHDREWVVVGENMKPVAMTHCPKMTLIMPSVEEGVLILHAPQRKSVRVPLVTEGVRIPFHAWDADQIVVDQGDAVAGWLSEYLGKPCRLMRMAPEFKRHMKEKYQKSGDEVVGFNFFSPFLVTTEASLADLNARLATPVPMDRFRPNIVIAGATAFQEDAWKRIRIGDIILRMAKLCVRCEITTVNHITAEKGVEPMETLGTYRTSPKGITFGQYCIHENKGTMRVGDPVEILG